VRIRGFLCAVATIATLTACSPTLPPALGLWELADPSSVTSESTTLDLGVTRLECASGVTGDVLEPQVTYEDDRILIRTDVAPLGLEAADCQGNDVVPIVIELAEPVGDRDLVDAACSDDRAAATVFCEDDGVRWSG
jgi:hypothetical protein